MVKRREFRILSSDGIHRLHGVQWIPEGHVCAAMVLVHGMEEHIGRYEEFGRYLAQNGIGTIGYDQLGHGKTVKNADELGYFAPEQGSRLLLQDIRRMTFAAKKFWPDAPVYLLGHSMGSFLARRWITLFGDEISGVVLSGTGMITRFESGFACDIARLIRLLRGPKYRSRILEAMAIGQYRRQFGTHRHPGSWLSSNEASVAAYKADPLCGFPFTNNAYCDFFHILSDLAWERDFDKIPQDLPILLISGMDDPLGGFQKRVLAVYNRFTAMNMEDVDIYLYPHDRHEILQENDRDTVFRDVVRWMEDRIPAAQQRIGMA